MFQFVSYTLKVSTHTVFLETVTHQAINPRPILTAHVKSAYRP